MGELHLNDVFWTLQGEGMHAGRRALFVRMPYCDLACPWCDTEFNSHKEWTEYDFWRFAAQEKARFAVVTGGEPMMHKHTPAVVKILKQHGFYIATETNGHFPIVPNIDFVTVSPKGYGKEPWKICSDAWKNASEFKYVIEKGFPWEILDKHNLYDGKRYSLSPEFNRMDESVSEILAYIKEHPQWRLSLQTHKIIGIP